ncbi:MAG: very short patch repair endonuclease [Planctomycetaceae bacterium]
MTDNLTRDQRSYCMSRVKGKDTVPEVVLRSALHRRGHRFRKHVRTLPGKPDIVFPRQRLVVFVDGGFWHGYRFPQWKDRLAPFWRDKINANRLRDRRNLRQLRLEGWTVIRVWQHQIERSLDWVITRIEDAIHRPCDKIHL